MSIKHVFRTAAALFLTAALLCPAARAEGRSGDVISTALGEVGYTEEDGEYSKYGAWYEPPNSYWCDMFVSWYVYTAGIPKTDFPRHCVCTSHVKLFVQLGRYQASAARGGSYIPMQGVVIFFYNPVLYPSGSVKNHAGLVLYTEDGCVSPTEAQDILRKAQKAVGLDPVEYAFSEGDYSYILDRPYIIRADAVQAFYDLLDRVPQVADFPGTVTLNGQPLNWPVLTAAYAQYTVCYVPLESLRPTLEFLGVDVAWTGDASGHGIELTPHIP